MAGKKGQKKRFWSDEEKVSICVQTCAPGVSVAQGGACFGRTKVDPVHYKQADA